MALKKATRGSSYLRLAIFGIAGGGKTLTALRVASGLATEMGLGPNGFAVYDTEAGSSEKYANRSEFGLTDWDIEETTDLSLDRLNAFLDEAKNAGIKVLVIDSLTHSWQELLEEIDRIAKTKYRGNSWAAWSEGTPKQKALIRRILTYPGHIIATMRCSTEWTSERDKDGKNRPVRLGLKPEAGKGIEYEFDMLWMMDDRHVAKVDKDRTGKYQDKEIVKPDQAFAKELYAWLTGGIEPTPKTTPKTTTKTKAKAKETLSPKGEKTREMQQDLIDWMKTHSFNISQTDWLLKIAHATAQTDEEWVKIADELSTRFEIAKEFAQNKGAKIA